MPRAQTVAEIERELLRMYRDPALTEKPALLDQRGGAYYSEAAVGLVASLVSDDGGVHVVDTRNGSTLAGLADDDVVEVPARVGADGPVPLPQPPLAPELLGLVQHVAAYERLAVEAATTRDPVVARKALLAHPLVGQVDMVDALLESLRGGGSPMSLALAVDGGNAKTDLALVAEDGAALALVRGPGSSPHEHGVDGALDRIGALLEQALAESGADAREIAIAELLLAGVDFPGEVATAKARAEARGWAGRVEVGNDTFAVLRAGTDRGWGVAVVCGAGINCVGLAPDGRQARFPALGPITGDWGGGYDVGLAAVVAAARSEDGRGPHTTLERAVPAHFGLRTPLELAEAVHTGAIPQRRVVELAPLVLAEAAADAVAAGIVARLASEVVALVRVALARLEPSTSRSRSCSAAGCCRRAIRACSRAIDARPLRARHRPRHDRRRPAAHRRRGAARARRARRARDGVRASAQRARSGGRAAQLRNPGGAPWLTSASTRRRGSIRGRRRRPSTRSTCTSRTASSSCSSGRRAPARRRRCGCSPGSRRSTPGAVLIGGRDVTDDPPKKRDIAMVFQNYALYPYLTVAANIGFPLKIAGVKKSERERRVGEAAELLGLTEYLDRKPGQLSGGQRQRVAMGRAIVRARASS